MQTASPKPSAIAGIGQIHISVSAIARAIAFYRDVLGLNLLFECAEPPMAFFDCGGVRLYIGVPTSPEYKANSFIYYRVGDINAAYRRLSTKGVNFLHEPRLVHKTHDSELWMAGFRDPDGNYAQIMSEKTV